MIDNSQTNQYFDKVDVRIALNLISLKYGFVVDELTKALLDGELSNSDAVNFLIEEITLKTDVAEELVNRLNVDIIEPFYLDEQEEESINDKEQNITPVDAQSSSTNWKDFIRPKILQSGMKDLSKASSGDVSRVRNYLWKNLGLNKAEEVVVILSWLARTGELAKLWLEDNRFKGILKKYISIKYSDATAGTAINKLTPALLSSALDMVLVEKLNLSRSDSAMISMAVIDQMTDDEKPKYILIAYIDSKDNTFNWNKIQEIAGILQLSI